jgi:hypothetical protein
MKTFQVFSRLAAVQTAVRANPTGAARFSLCDGFEGLDTIELSSPAVYDFLFSILDTDF